MLYIIKPFLQKLRYLLQLLLTQIVGWSAECHGSWFTRIIIKLFILFYKVNMQESLQQDIAFYKTFNAFFIRYLNKNARPINSNPSVIVQPADGIISQLGTIQDHLILQAKKHFYSLEALLAGQTRIINYFRCGNFTTIYLSPRDYHRVHMPCNGVLRQMIYVPGNLFSVNPSMVTHVPNLFARNERVICLFDSNFGLIAQILVGATIVGSIATIWSGTVMPPREKVIKCWHYPKFGDKNAVILLKGQEMGYFKLGSTVINLFRYGRIELCDHLYTNCITRVGLPLGYSNKKI
ncbi:archaetidylserine decarboxylase [Candidatus Palibaumannia cicadellinicola]|uniref:Phosphatidylserine decarboxylase proenzyme n=1 Tax=Baumannia cicadellinicola subsp. Homalodisca coagulata TaxID=374463 RepID=PSD_BAUCH|nr:archaetidylserine decarboxylase [Candidatus Baumannia cicadellinicola]Q1LSP9.1 RecName: Full=Phosphatidylserine decarboxylase proenzyme; Contains: RecName: Full=Phosphatidylserine decarboxylase alpha chain; Contains: RecName: Full=Phosphatidylserine decarboxylase beta chain [Baumannia cicadellinicola str. Hc (Homalodisca coagulata)]ABF13816.1 phosphatidylserine decarboxylase [Baumannia cicadellinicola str. Hc (Homalodisca coagulata)]MCJ7461930.1 archaetidylserine decarboxylase [Candidatus Bau